VIIPVADSALPQRPLFFDTMCLSQFARADRKTSPLRPHLSTFHALRGVTGGTRADRLDVLRDLLVDRESWTTSVGRTPVGETSSRARRRCAGRGEVIIGGREHAPAAPTIRGGPLRPRRRRRGCAEHGLHRPAIRFARTRRTTGTDRQGRLSTLVKASCRRSDEETAAVPCGVARQNVPSAGTPGSQSYRSHIVLSDNF
jgi:hypothetical protein